MRTALCTKLGIELPIFAFSHCRDVVAAVSRAGGLGVLGALGFSAEELEAELQSFTGKPNRMLRNAWTEAWAAPDTPDPLGMPLQYMVTAEAVDRTSRYAGRSQKVAFNAAGQVVGMLHQIRGTRDAIDTLVDEYLDAVERLGKLSPDPK